MTSRRMVNIPMLLYSIFFVFIAISAIQDDFSLKYHILFILCAICVDIAVFVGNILYSFYRFDLPIVKHWKWVFWAWYVFFLIGAIVDFSLTDLKDASVISKIVRLLSVLVMLFPSFVANYVLAYKTRKTPIKFENENMGEMISDSKRKEVSGIQVSDSSVYFAVSLRKLIFLSVFTCGLYQFYWHYKNWKAIKLQTRPNYVPWLAALLYFFSTYDLFVEILTSATKKQFRSDISAGKLTIFYILLTLSCKLPTPYWWISILSFIPLLYIQKAINFNNAVINPDYKPDDQFTYKTWIIIIVGSVALFLAIYGTIYGIN